MRGLPVHSDDQFSIPVSLQSLLVVGDMNGIVGTYRCAWVPVHSDDQFSIPVSLQSLLVVGDMNGIVGTYRCVWASCTQ